MLKWDETDFIECLEVIPDWIRDDAGEVCIFNVSKKGIELELSVFPLEEDVRFRLNREGEIAPFFEYQILGCIKVECQRDKSGSEYLIFTNKNETTTSVSVSPDIFVEVLEKCR